MKNTALIIDAQVFQTAAWHRGMGKYSAALLSALKDAGFFRQYKSIYYVVNNNLTLDEAPQNFLNDVLFGASQIVVDFENPPPHTKSLKGLQASNRRLLDAAIAEKNIEAPEYFILSLFLDEACVVFPSVGKKLLLFYDLIPFLYYERYKPRINYEGYLDHFSTIFEADRIFNISQTVTNDNYVYLGIPKEKLINIDGASIDRSGQPTKKPTYELGDNIILMPSGDELRKNNLRAVKGFEEFNARHGGKYKLVVTSRFSDYTKNELSAYSDDIMFTGNIEEEELQWVYEHAEVVLFPSEYEGLGLPILEAMSVHKRIACSNIPVFNEISSEAFYVFDQFDPNSIANALDSAIDAVDWHDKRAKYKAILEEYSWKRTAQKLMDGHKSLHESRTDTERKPKVAILAPHPAGYSAIGKVVAESHAEYSRLFEIEYYFDYGPYHREVRPDFLSHIATVHDVADFSAEKYKEYDAVIYHIGNSDYHLGSIRNALYLPGYVILHDTYLDGAFGALENGGRISHQRYEMEKRLNSLGLEGGSFLASLISNQIGVITHSQYAADVAAQVISEGALVKKAALPVATPKFSKNSSLNSNFQIGLAGIIADVKGLEIISALAMSPAFVDCTINIFGHSFAKPEVADQFRKWPNVKVVTDPTDFEFQTLLAKLDVLINYRMEYRGETSLTTLEAMRYGVPVIVRGDIGWYSELPDDSVIKALSPNEVLEKVELLKMNRGIVESVGRQAAEFTAKHNTHAAYAELMRATIASKPDAVTFNAAEHIRASSGVKESIRFYED